jgi:hypothetical protein
MEFSFFFRKHFAILKNLADYEILSPFSPVTCVGTEKEFVVTSFKLLIKMSVVCSEHYSGASILQA